MQSKNFTVYRALDIVPPPIPERSYLYRLQPVGMGSPYCESIISYLYRLSEQHSISLERLLSSILKIKWNLTKNHIFHDPFFVDQIVTTLEEMTGYDGLRQLTLLLWMRVIRYRFLYNYYQKWCPICYQEWRELGQPIYLPILWTLEIVNFCPRHTVPLTDRCQVCRMAWNILSKRVRVDFCPYCNAWLGSSRQVTKDTPFSYNQERFWNSFILSSMCQLIFVNSRLDFCVEKTRISNLLKALLKFHNLSITRFYKITSFHKVTKLSKTSFGKYCNFNNIPRLENLIYMASYFNVSLVDLLIEDIESLIPKMIIY